MRVAAVARRLPPPTKLTRTCGCGFYVIVVLVRHRVRPSASEREACDVRDLHRL